MSNDRILKKKASCDALKFNHKGFNCLHVAVLSRDTELETVRLILKYVPVDEPSLDESSSLMLVVGAQRFEKVEILLRAGANIHHRNQRNITPLQIALFSPDNDILRSILEKQRGEAAIFLYKESLTGFTPMQYDLS